MIGGEGGDLYCVDTGDVVTEDLAVSGHDTVTSDGAHLDGSALANVDVLTLLGNLDLNITGGAATTALFWQ